MGANSSIYLIKPYRCSPVGPKASVHATTGAGETLGAASPGTGDTVPRMRMVCGLQSHHRRSVARPGPCGREFWGVREEVDPPPPREAAGAWLGLIQLWESRI